MPESTIHDTHRYVKELTNAGLAEPIAELIADREARLLEHNIATKQDIAQLQQATKADLSQMEVRLTRWVVGTTATTILAVIGIIAGFIK